MLTLPGVTHQEAQQLKAKGLGQLPQLAEALQSRQRPTEKVLESILGSAAAARECAQVWLTCLQYFLAAL